LVIWFIDNLQFQFFFFFKLEGGKKKNQGSQFFWEISESKNFWFQFFEKNPQRIEGPSQNNRQWLYGTL
jgi:hypothetical protein